MKALLKTRCGCSRMIDIFSKLPRIYMALESQMEYHSCPCLLKKEAIFKTRVFEFSKWTTMDGNDIPVYIEEKIR